MQLLIGICSVQEKMLSLQTTNNKESIDQPREMHQPLQNMAADDIHKREK
jgi:hypothetical protein